MNRKTVITARIDAGLNGKLRKLADATKRGRSWHVAEALRWYLDSDQQFLAAVAEGRRALAEGKTTTHTQVKRRFQRRLVRGR
jgi:predicted transcriptional regulator